MRGALDLVCETRGEIPSQDAPFVAARGKGRARDAGGRDILLMATDHTRRSWVAVDEVVQVAFQVDADDQSVTAARGPDNADLLVRDARDALVAHSPRLDSLACLGVPDAHGLVGAGGDEALRVLGPRDAEDAACVHAVANLRLGLARLAVIQPDALVGADAREDGAVRGEGGTKDEAVVLAAQAGVELEGGAVVEDQAGVVGARGGAQRALLADGDAVDLRRVARDLSHAVAAVGGDAVAKALFAIADGDDALRVAVPGNVVDAAGDDVVLALGRALAGAVPHAHAARDVAAGHIESRRREARDRRLRRVLRVLLADGGVVDGAEEDGLARLVTWFSARRRQSRDSHTV